MSYFSKRALRWAAPVALVGALGLAACGNSDDTEAIKVAAPSAVGVGSDQHLSNKAEELARVSASAGSDQHLNNQAAEIASQRVDRAASARLTGQAEQIQRAEAARLSANAERAERTAKLESQVETYRSSAAPTNSDANLPNAFEAGNRAVEMTQAPAYVWQQQHPAESSTSGSDSSSDEFVPGSRHMPTR